VLLTGGDDRFLRFSAAGGNGEPEVATHALWWPPTKIAGRYLAPFLFDQDELEVIERIRDGALPVEADLGLVASALGP
jgi:sulfide:quinone oxidoreductase